MAALISEVVVPFQQVAESKSSVSVHDPSSLIGECSKSGFFHAVRKVCLILIQHTVVIKFTS